MIIIILVKLKFVGVCVVLVCWYCYYCYYFLCDIVMGIFGIFCILFLHSPWYCTVLYYGKRDKRKRLLMKSDEKE
jgi:hypothetical protein